MPTLQTVGTIQELAEQTAMEVQLLGADKNNFLLLSIGLPQWSSALLVELFTDLEAYYKYLQSRPFSYQRQAFSLRNDQFFCDSGCRSFRDIVRHHKHLQIEDIAEIIEISLSTKHSLLHLCQGVHVSPIGLDGIFQLGFAFWLEQFHFTAWCLTELVDSDILAEEAKHWLKPLLKPLLFLEQTGTELCAIWQGQIENRPAFISDTISIHRLRLLFLLMFSDIKNLPLSAWEETFLREVSACRSWWDEALQTNQLKPIFIADWITKFGRFYLEAFFLCALNSLRLSSGFNFAKERFTSIFLGLISEEVFVAQLFKKLEQSVNSGQAATILAQRWQGKLGTTKSLRRFVLDELTLSHI